MNLMMKKIEKLRKESALRMGIPGDAFLNKMLEEKNCNI